MSISERDSFLHTECECYATEPSWRAVVGQGREVFNSVHAEALDNMGIPVANPADSAGERTCMHCAGYRAAPKNSSWLLLLGSVEQNKELELSYWQNDSAKSWHSLV